MLCPPARTATSRPVRRARVTAATTSSGARHRAITAGRLSTMAFQTRRAWS
ncbi:MAG: hypothetical protein K0S88_3721 [Actinomycetia bacterium]|nr:hypothetical protein [Actinomycetes bacterium]